MLAAYAIVLIVVRVTSMQNLVVIRQDLSIPSFVHKITLFFLVATPYAYSTP